MDETILFPSPNWFQVSGLAVSRDNWVFYGGPSKSLCVLEPLPSDFKSVYSGNQSYQAHVRNRAHPEKIVSVAVSPEWPEKKLILTGSADGTAKQWHLERVDREFKIKCSHSHDVHHNEGEEIVGVGYSTDNHAVTVGNDKNIIKWDLSSNVVKKIYNVNLKNFKPVSMACSPHIPLQVAVGTKQGIIFVWDLTGQGRVLFKVRAHDDEVLNISWCPQYETVLTKTQSQKKFTANNRMEKIRNEPEPTENKALETSGVIKNLPDDSFDESRVSEDDMFDIYKDHEADEFGHKKYEPEEIRVKIKTEEKPVDYLAECLKLKEDILKKKNEPEPSIQSLVDKLDETHVDERSTQSVETNKPPGDSGGQSTSQSEEQTKNVVTESNSETQKHLLASVGKHGGVKIWSKSGKLVGSCIVMTTNKNPNVRNKGPTWCTLMWYKADTLLIADGRNQLLECNPLLSDAKSKLTWRVVHTLHKRGLHCIATNAPRVQTPSTSFDGCSIWTAAQDRYLIQYSVENKNTLAEYATCGGYLYSVVACPYDAGKVAISVGDGAVRVLQMSDLAEDESVRSPGHVSTYWQNVQGKVLITAWHPTKENILAFATAESRVGVINMNGKTEKAARVLWPALVGGVYSISFDDAHNLYACATGQLVVYNTEKPDTSPTPMSVVFEGSQWEISSVMWRAGLLVCGSTTGAVAVLEKNGRGSYEVTTAVFLYNKMIHTMDWHPQEISSSTDESPHRNLIATCSLDKQNAVIILEYSKTEDGSKQLKTWKTLHGHKNSVLVVAWNPHKEALLLSTSMDTSIRIWDAVAGTCISIFGGHTQSSLGAAWSAFPHMSTKVLSGGGDSCLRFWDINDHPTEAYDDTKYEIPKRERKRKEKKEDSEQLWTPAQLDAVSAECLVKPPRKYTMPNTYDQMSNATINAPRKMLQKYCEKNGIVWEVENNEEQNEKEEKALGFLRLFGSINEVNELLDFELEHLEESNNHDGCVVLSVFRGHIDAAVQFAAQRDILSPFLVSMAPCVSLKYWKEVSQLYLAQVDRLVAQGEIQSLCDQRYYGGCVYRKAVTLLSIHDIKGAVDALTQARMYKEAYILCRTRYMDSIAEQTLRQWAHENFVSGVFIMAAVCYLALGDLPQAATALAKCDDQETLRLAADIAKLVGLNTLADHYEKKAQEHPENTEELLEKLPSRIELLLKDEIQIGEGVTSNGSGEAEDKE